ncbi:MAG: glycosyltransferase family 2 protein [Bacilli bacterium]
MKRISVILPCYNEEESLPFYFDAVDDVIKDIKDYQFDFVLVNDGSNDNTLRVMHELYTYRNDITIVNLAKNFGQNPAFSAGLVTAKGDFVIMMDSDLQDPVTLLKEIADKFTDGFDVVSPHRTSRKEDSLFKRKSAGFFYKFINKIEGKKVLPENINCFRGLSRRAVDVLNSLPEKDRLIITEIPLIGMKTCHIDFSREKRQAGTSKYNLKKMVNYAFDNISSGTSHPLYTPIIAGSVMTGFFSVSSLALLIIYILGLCNVILPYSAVTVFMIISFIFLGVGIIVFTLGILALYEHNILINTRGRPTFIIDKVYRQEDK